MAWRQRTSTLLTLFFESGKAVIEIISESSELFGGVTTQRVYMFLEFGGHLGSLSREI